MLCQGRERRGESSTRSESLHNAYYASEKELEMPLQQIFDYDIVFIIFFFEIIHNQVESIVVSQLLYIIPFIY